MKSNHDSRPTHCGSLSFSNAGLIGHHGKNIKDMKVCSKKIQTFTPEETHEVLTTLHATDTPNSTIYAVSIGCITVLWPGMC